MVTILTLITSLFVAMASGFCLMALNVLRNVAAATSKGRDKSHEVAEFVRMHLRTFKGEYPGRINEVKFDADGHISRILFTDEASGNSRQLCCNSFQCFVL